MRASLRREVSDSGVLVDPWIARAAQIPAFGLNLACAWPFPAPALEAYRRFAGRLTDVPGLTVYEDHQTHITLVTLVAFHLHLAPSQGQWRSLEPLAERTAACLRQGFRELADLHPFELRPEAPLLTRKACLIPWANAGGEIARIRSSLVQWITAEAGLPAELRSRGLNVPGIIHSTVARFSSDAVDAADVLRGFDSAVAAFDMPPVRVDEIMVTAELAPYMARGEVRHRLSLAQTENIGRVGLGILGTK
jgi:hypothetical protein